MTSRTEPTPPAATGASGTADAVQEAPRASRIHVGDGGERLPAAAGRTQPDAADVRDKLWQLGWTQGSILPEVLRAEVQRIPFAPTAEDDEIAIVITQGCDAIQGDCAVEPALEVVLARPIAKVNPNMKVLKNPRLLHVDILASDGTRQPIEVAVWRRGFIDRRLLLDHAPATHWTLPADSLDLIILLFGRRYDRVALPDAFVERFRPVAARLEKHIERLAAEITGVFLRVDPDMDYPADEDPEAHPYDVAMYFMMSDALSKNDARQDAIYSQLKNDLLPLVNKTPGLKAKPMSLMHPFRMTVGEFRDLTEWDHEPLRQGLAAKAAPQAKSGGGPPRPAPRVIEEHPAASAPPSSSLSPLD